MKLLYIFLSLLMIGCATKQEYAFQATKPNLNFSSDKLYCYERAMNLNNADYYYMCMESRGWKKVPKNAPQSEPKQSSSNQSNPVNNTSPWVSYASRTSAGVEYFYDSSSLWRNRDTVKVTDKALYDSLQTFPGGKARYNQIKSRHEINCKTLQAKLESMVFMKVSPSDSDIVVDAGGEGKFKQISKGSVISYLADAVCE